MCNDSGTLDRENILESPKKVAENSNNLNVSYSAWVIDGIVESSSIFDKYGDKQPHTTLYSVFNGMLNLVISELRNPKKSSLTKMNSIN